MTGTDIEQNDGNGNWPKWQFELDPDVDLIHVVWQGGPDEPAKGFPLGPWETFAETAAQFLADHDFGER